MLNKKICIKCSEKEFELVKWNEDFMDEYLWQNGYVMCPFSVTSEEKEVPTKLAIKTQISGTTLLSVRGKIPEDCPYKLEHLMMDKKHA